MIITIFYSTAVCFSKLSILSFYLRLSPAAGFRLAVYTLIGIVTAYTIAYEFLSILQCSPVEKFWKPALKGSCIGRMIPMMTLSVANAVIDVVILLIPLRVVLPLQMPARQKASLVLLFATGGLWVFLLSQTPLCLFRSVANDLFSNLCSVCAATIQRTVILPGLLRAKDYTWEVPPQMVWGFIEINAGLICASVPALRPLFVRYLPFLIASTLRSSQERPDDKGSEFDSLPSNKGRSKKHKKSGLLSFELQTRDDVLATGSNEEDDETKLWRRTGGIDQGTGGSSDGNSFDGIENQYPGKVEHRTVVSTVDSRVASPGKGISVTKETRVSYGS